MKEIKVELKKLFCKTNQEIKIGGFVLTNKDISQLEIGEATYPKQSGRYAGCSVGRDKQGYFVFTHRARSPSYDTPQQIPDSRIKWIESTGTKIK